LIASRSSQNRNGVKLEHGAARLSGRPETD
jgi:hypothetical protein